tara:strand:- start:215 stop:628 length:414 start_codon:yes stop_codon:yes gene_type:complete
MLSKEPTSWFQIVLWILLLSFMIFAVLDVGIQGILKPSNPIADHALLEIAKVGNIEAVKQVVANGADVNAKDTIGYTPLHHAAFGGHKEVAELLIAKGADVNAKDKNGNKPLDAANDGDQPEIVDLLVKHGAVVRTQ